MRALNNRRLTHKLLPIHLKQLEKIAQRCEDGVKVTSKKFEDWLDKASKIKNACFDSQGIIPPLGCRRDPDLEMWCALLTLKVIGDTEEAFARVTRDLADSKMDKDHWGEVSVESANAKRAAEEDVAQSRRKYEKAIKNSRYGRHPSKFCTSYNQLTTMLFEGLTDFLSDIGRGVEGVAHRGLDCVQEGIRTLPYYLQPMGPPGRPFSGPSPQNSPPIVAPPQTPSYDFVAYDTILSSDFEVKFAKCCKKLTPENATNFVTKFNDTDSQLIGSIVGELQMHLGQDALASTRDGLAREVRELFMTMIKVSLDTTDAKNSLSSGGTDDYSLPRKLSNELRKLRRTPGICPMHKPFAHGVVDLIQP